MEIKIGVPRALFYYYYYPLWKRFFENLAAEVVVSPETNKKILDMGIRYAVDEACLPVKCYYGHVLSLKDQVDYILAPRLVSVEKRAYICPKFMGIPDMIRSNINGLPPLIDTVFNYNDSKRTLNRTVQEMGSHVSGSPREIKSAWREAVDFYERFISLTYSGLFPDEAIDYLEGKKLQAKPEEENGADRLRIALLGRCYILYDDYLSLGLTKKLRKMGVEVVTPDIIPHSVTENEAEKLPKRMFWTLGKRLLGGTMHYLNSGEVDGIIYIASFGCGPDSIVADLSERYIRRNGSMPFQLVTVDEHTGEAGVLTRIEAFVDMLKWRGVS